MKQDNITEWVEQYSQEVKQALSNGEIKDGEYCIIISTFTGSGFTETNKNISKVYKNVDQFEKKAVAELETIDPTFGINVLTYVFD